MMELDSTSLDTIDFALRHVDPKAYYREFLSRNIRLDGRGLREHRRIVVSKGVYGVATSGSSMVRCGNTRFSCGVRYEVGTPLIQSPECGGADVMVSLWPLCSPQYERAKSDEAFELEQFLTDLLLRCGK